MNPTTFSITFSDWDFSQQVVWVILHTLAGDSATAVRQVTQNGVVDFGDVGSDRVTVTIAINRPQSDIMLESYFGVPAGSWVWSQFPSDTVGTADITFAYASGQYSIATLIFPGYQHSIVPGSDDTTHLQWSAIVNRLGDENKFSAYGLIESVTDTKCGWILDQPFTPLQSNPYTIDLMHDIQTRTVTASRPLRNLTLVAYRGNSYAEFALASTTSLLFDTTSHTLRYGAFPAQKFSLSGSNWSESENYGYVIMSNTIPTNLNIPTGTVTASYDSSANRFHNISYTGRVDAIIGTWRQSGLDQSTVWNSYVGSSSQVVTLPMLPDSVASSLGLSMSELSGWSMEILDYDPAEGLDGVISLYFRGNDPWPARFNTSYYYSTYVGVTTTESTESQARFRNELHHKMPF
jgi:hypothetical protein